MNDQIEEEKRDQGVTLLVSDIREVFGARNHLHYYDIFLSPLSLSSLYTLCPGFLVTAGA